MEGWNKLSFIWRTLRANRLCTVISVVGLGIGLACTIVIIKYIWQEYTTDQFHQNYDRIYCCTSRASDMSVPGLDETLDLRKNKTVYPEIEAYTSLGLFDDEPLIVNRKSYKCRIGITSSAIFRVFSMNLIVGDTTTALQRETDIVIARHLARKLFGNADPLGKEITFWAKVYRISGVMEDLPVNSTLAFDALIQDRGDFGRVKAEFILLKENCDIQKVTERINREEMWRYPSMVYEYVPFAGLYFNPAISTDLIKPFGKGNIRFLTILMFAALIILSISLVNYVNISQVALLKREKELGVKKVHGMGDMNLWFSFWLENLVLVIGAILMALVLLFTLANFIKTELDITLQLHTGFDILLLLGTLLVLPVITSVWPFYKFRNIQPAIAVKSSGSGKKNGIVRRILLGFQYVLTLVMLIVSFYFIKQLHFMLNKDIGVHKENILSAGMFKELRLERIGDDDTQIMKANIEHNEAISEKYTQDIQYVLHELEKWPYIQNACSTCSPLEYQPNDWKAAKPEMDFIYCPTLTVVPEFKELYGLKLKEGRFFEVGKDNTRGSTVVINETAQKCFGIKNLEEDRLMNKYWSVFNESFQVIGVVEDFRFTHLSDPVQPLVMVWFGDTEGVPYQMHITPGKERETILFLRQLYEKLEPDGELEYHFFQDEVDQLYAKDRKMVRIATLFTVLAVFISAFGLFGFSYFDARQRQREIGIRKVNGATISEVLRLLIGRFLVLIGIAFGISIPLAWWIIHRYQESFIETTPASWWLFAGAFMFTACIVFITMYHQSWKAAHTNPVEALKRE